MMKRKATEHPYKALEPTRLWSVVDRALSELESNKDVLITTRREYVVGLITKRCLASRDKPKNTTMKKLEPPAAAAAGRGR